MPANNFFNLYLRVNDKEVKTTFNSLKKDLSALYSYRGNLDPKLDKVKWDEASKKIEEVKKKKEDLIQQTRLYSDSVDDSSLSLKNFSQSATDAFSSLMAGDLIGFKTGMVGVKASIMGATKAAWAFIATPVGAAITALAAIAVATKLWFNYNEAALEANRITQQMTQLSGDALDAARVRGKTIEKTFGTDFKQTLEVAKNLVQAFGISYEEAFDRIEDGLIRGGKESDEFMKSLREYPKLFAQAGFTVEEFQRIVNTGIDMGVYDDKLPDAIKEFSLAIMEETTNARVALENAFGKEFTDKVFKGIQDGSLSSKEALKLISAEAETIGLNAQQAQLLTADLFKGAGEDAGGALVIFEAVNTALNEQVRALTPLEAELQRVADANNRLANAQDAALKSDQYSAFVNDISVAWINFKAVFFEGMNAVLDGLVNIDTKFRRLVFQSVQYTKDAFTIGPDAGWDKLGAQFDKKQKELEKQAAAQRDAEKPKEETPEDKALKENAAAKKNATEKAAAEAKKRQEARVKTAIAEENKRLEAIDNLKAEYQKREEDREADSAVKKAELEQERAIKNAQNLGAEQDIIDQIKAEHQVKINEAKAAEEEKELERLRAFEERKKELEDELELAKAETEAEKEEIRKEQALEKEEALYEKKLAKFEEEMAFLQMTEEEKNAVVESLKEAHENVVLGIQKKYTDQKIKDEQRLNTEKKKLINDSLDAVINAAGAETKVGQMLLLAKQFLAIKETAIQLGLFQNKMALNLGEATGAAATGAAETAKVGFPQNIPLLIGFGIQIAGIISAVKNAAKAKSNVKTPSFARGGYTDLFGMGYKDATGHEVAGDVHVGEYVVPKVVRQDPEVPPILDYLEAKRKKKLNLYADGGDAASGSSVSVSAASGAGIANIDALLQKLLDRLDAPLEAPIYFGYEAEQKRQEAQKKLKAIQDRAQIKKN